MRALPLVLLLALAPSALAQPPGLPGTATPQPYAQPQLRSLPAAPRSSQPLLVSPHRTRSPLAAPQPLPRDRPLPQLESQRRSQQSHPAESIGKP